MRDTFIIQQDLSFKELCSSSFIVLAGGRLIKRYFVFLSSIIVVSFLLGALTSSDSSLGLERLLIIILAPVFLMTVFAIGLLLSCLFFYRNKPVLFRNVTYRFTHWGMEKTGKGILLTRPWSGFTKFRETPSFLLLYVSENDAHVIQKTMFSDKAELEAFKAFLKFHLPA